MLGGVCPHSVRVTAVCVALLGVSCCFPLLLLLRPRTAWDPSLLPTEGSERGTVPSEEHSSGTGNTESMAWRCSGRSNAELIANLKMSRLIRNARVEQAMLSVDRSGYCLPTTDAYRDAPQTIGYSATISAPHMHAWCLELLEPFLQPGSKVLDVGSGSGYLTACFAKMVSPGGKAFGIEHIQELVDWSVRNTQQSNGELFREGVISFQVADGFNGLSEHACYNAIHVGAAAPSIPQALLDQLCPGGRMVIPVGTWDQSLVQVDKDRDGHVTQSTITGVRYVPLTTREKQIR